MKTSASRRNFEIAAAALEKQERWRSQLSFRHSISDDALLRSAPIIDCRSRRFCAIEAHINFSLTAYVIQKESGRRQMRIEEYVRKTELAAIKVELTKFGSTTRLKTRVDAALQRMAS